MLKYNSQTKKHKNINNKKHNSKTLKHTSENKHEKKDLIKVFTEVYETNKWGDNDNPNYEGSSGLGSAIWYNKKTYIPFIHKFLKKYKIKSVVDLGCGDFRIGLLLYGKTNIDYTGYDAYKGVIDYNNERFKENHNFHFIHSDFTSVQERKKIKNADLCIIKDVLQHLPNDTIINFMNYIIKSNKFKYILIINCYNTTTENTKDYRKDIVGGEFSSLSALRYPLNKYGARVIYKWDTKEVSLININKPIVKKLTKIKTLKGGSNNTPSTCKKENIIDIFSNKVYESNKWGDNDNTEYEGSSGEGSKLWYNKNTYIPFIRHFFDHNNIKSVVDLGCGDFLIGEEIYEDLKIEYTGYDAYKKLIEYHNKKYKPYTIKYKENKNRYSLSYNTSKKEGILILNPKLKHMSFNFIHADFTNNPENIISADLCIIKDVLQHLPNCIIEKFMDYITNSKQFKYILLINCYNTTPENKIDFRKDITPGEFSSLSSLKYPLLKYGAREIYKWDTKEVSLITL